MFTALKVVLRDLMQESEKGGLASVNENPQSQFGEEINWMIGFLYLMTSKNIWI